ncbi:unnamed protein product [Lota lota]
MTGRPGPSLGRTRNPARHLSFGWPRRDDKPAKVDQLERTSETVGSFDPRLVLHLTPDDVVLCLLRAVSDGSRFVWVSVVTPQGPRPGDTDLSALRIAKPETDGPIGGFSDEAKL